MLLDNGFDVGAQPGKMAFDRFAAAGVTGIQAGDASAKFVAGLAQRFAGPAELALGGALAQLEALHGLGHEAAAGRAAQGLGSVAQQRAQRFGQFHGLASDSEGRHSSAQLQGCKFAAGRAIIVKPP